VSRLADLIEEQREAIAQRFAERVRATHAATSLGRETAIDTLRELLDELCTHLRSSERHETRAQGSAAAEHGEQRYEIGYEVGAVIREYNLVLELVYDVVAETGAEVTLDEHRVLSRALLRGIAQAATSYANKRDEELRARTAEHIGFLAHELRNPLGSALLAVSLLRDRGVLENSRPATALTRSLTRLSTLIDDALVSVRLQHVTSVRLDTIDVGALLRDLLSEAAADADAKDVRVHLEGSGHCVGDARALRSAVSNLVRNAVKFTPEGKDVVVRVKQADSRLFVEVEDSCGGIPAEAVHKLFDPFVQVGADRTGFGLGLAIAKQAAEAHGGEIRVHDLPGKGCVFVIDLPERPPGAGGSSTAKS